MTYEELLENAKKNIAPNCKVCKVCNGIACRGQTPGVGGKGSGNGFIVCSEFLSSVKIKMDTIYEDNGHDTTVNFFGKQFKYPIFAAPIGGMKLNYNDFLSEGQYDEAVVFGTNKAGCASFTGDGPNDQVFLESLPVIKQANGLAIPTIKPWDNKKVLDKIKMIEEVKAMAFAMDIDSAGLIHLAASGKPVFFKGVEELSEITSSAKIPFIIKGVMTANGAKKALEAGAYGIVVSSHGGRVLDDTPCPCAMLPEIRQAVGDKLKIFVDGGIRTGNDVFKAIALGADAVLIGRPYAIAAFGGGVEGVELYTNKIGSELRDAMLMTGCKSLKDISSDKIIF